MKTVVKYLALFAIVATAAKCFVDAFTPEYDAWREKYPPEPDDEAEDIANVSADVVSASDLFKGNEDAFSNAKGGE